MQKILTSGSSNNWQNIGIMYQFIEDQQINPVQVSTFMAIVRKSFGYGNKEVQISNKQLCEIVGVSDKTISKTLDFLMEKGFIDRIKWKLVGPKQAYKYRACFPDKKYGFINIKKDKIDIEKLNLEKAANESI